MIRRDVTVAGSSASPSVYVRPSGLSAGNTTLEYGRSQKRPRHVVMNSIVHPEAQPGVLLRCVLPDNTYLRRTGPELVRSLHMVGSQRFLPGMVVSVARHGTAIALPTSRREWLQFPVAAGSQPAGKRPELCLGHVTDGWREQHSVLAELVISVLL
jgi:hypothetical protein